MRLIVTIDLSNDLDVRETIEEAARALEVLARDLRYDDRIYARGELKGHAVNDLAGERIGFASWGHS